MTAKTLVFNYFVPLFAITVMALMTLQATAQTVLPDAPTPKGHKFFDRANKMAFTSAVVIRAADTAQTCYTLSIGWQEKMLPTQHCAGIFAFNASFIAIGLASAYALHRTNHHRLERWPLPVAALGSVIGILMTSSYHIH